LDVDVKDYDHNKDFMFVRFQPCYFRCIYFLQRTLWRQADVWEYDVNNAYLEVDKSFTKENKRRNKATNIATKLQTHARK